MRPIDSIEWLVHPPSGSQLGNRRVGIFGAARLLVAFRLRGSYIPRPAQIPRFDVAVPAHRHDWPA